MPKLSPLTVSLPYAGTLPFLAGAACAILGIKQLPVLGPVEPIVLAYGLAILSFMAGVHWGQHLSGLQARINLLVSSNAVTLAGWAGFWLLPKAPYCFLLIALFAALLWIDTQLARQGQIEAGYAKTRTFVTGIVCISLLLTGLGGS